MTGFRLPIALVLFLVLPVASNAAPQQEPSQQEPSQQEPSQQEPASEDLLAQKRKLSLAMTNRINELIRNQWQELEITPAETTDDSEFLRRVYLDLTGVVPAVYETRKFLKDATPDKRRELIRRLLDSPNHATHMAATWRRVMVPGGFDAAQAASAAGLQGWLRKQFAANFRYDRIVSEFLVATGPTDEGPTLFYTAQEVKPEKLADSTARIFLGVQIGCAQCHDHPDGRWTQDDFWNYAAFFARLEQPPAENSNVTRIIENTSGELQVPDSERIAKPKYPGGKNADASSLRTRREQLALWVASRENPYLPVAAVNWSWSHLFGRGLVDPVDDIGPHNPASHPELLNELAEYFVRSGYDLRLLMETIANSEAYQQSSRYEQGTRPDEASFAVMGVKSMTAEQLYDSLQTILARRRLSRTAATARERFIDPQRQMFIAKLGAQSRSALEFNAGLPQALMLMNGLEIEAATNVEQSSLLIALTAPFFSDSQRLETIFLAAVSRAPRAEETEEILMVLGETPEEDRQEVLGDILWALLNSSEFALNH
ncbi:MAG: hypothetical protein ACI9HK_002296 [Pirellulaceae bacterium]|jgi:hypothetical protein